VQKVLYLTVINMPSDEDLERAEEIIEESMLIVTAEEIDM
jgi:hypothetical protein